ncbi:MAG: hypothetical protein CME68_05280 [Halobacteriovoraceae bacterium]|nr:hypothetical protein [Halobacteriovoraceae bacterium]
MESPTKSSFEKTILVISDIHLGAGEIVNGKRNLLEDFHYDKEFIEFLGYYSSGVYAKREVELIINGDFLDFLAVPFVNYFDDEFWSEEAALEKLKIILDAHKDVIDSLVKFISNEKKKIIYIVGNHDGEFLFESMRDYFIKLFPKSFRNNILFRFEKDGEYSPHPGIVIKHGHEYEIPNQIDPEGSIISTEEGRKYFLPPWGSYYVTRVINKFKEERTYINLVRPIKKLLISGIIYDTLFTLRFMLANIYYIFMVRFILYFKYSKSLKEIIENMKRELKVFQVSETIVEDFFEERKDVGILIMGHTHYPSITTFFDGATFINTGTWVKMNYLDFDKQSHNNDLTYAKINVKSIKKSGKVRSRNLKNLDINFNVWKGKSENPFKGF